MKLPEESVLLRVFVGEADTHRGVAVYERIVLRARELGLAGATVTRGIMGFGAASRIHTARFLRLSEDMPVVVEIVDTEANVQKLLPYLDEVIEGGGLVTLERAQVIKYQPRRDP